MADADEDPDLAPSTAPPGLHVAEQPFSLAFHPANELLAVGLIDGTIEFHAFRSEREAGGGKPSLRFAPSSESRAACRALEFAPSGDALIEADSAGALRALDPDGRETWGFAAAHQGAAASTLVALGTASGDPSMHPALFASGDDEGVVRIWDLRAPTKACAELKVHEDFVSDLQVATGPPTADGSSQGSATLLSTGGDGRLSATELRRLGAGSKTDSLKSTHRSDPQDDELLSCAVLKHGRKVVCGTQAGVLVSYSYGRWGDSTDRFPGHPESVSTMLKVDESTVLTGSSDGLIRVVSLMPNQLLGVVGDHDDFPVETMRYSVDRTLVASLSHDLVVRFWDVSCFLDDVDDQDHGIPEDTNDASERKGALAREAKGREGEERSGDELDGDDDDDDDDDEGWEDMSDVSDDGDDGDDDEGASESRKRTPALPRRGGGTKSADLRHDFFADL